MDLNKYYRYLNKYSIEENKYPGHRRKIHELDRDIELPKTPDEILKTFEDQAKKIDKDHYRYFLWALGRVRSPKRSGLEKMFQRMVN